MGEKYLSIGKVAKLKNISIKALRYYDEIGILPPAYINPETNYRYYTNEQLPMLDAINLCLQLGIPLKTLPSYIHNGGFDYPSLLSDTRNLAEEKIHGIRLVLDRIESVCSVNTATDSTPALAVSSKKPENIAQPVIFAQDEYLLSLPLSEDLFPPFDGFVLKLFIFARQKNLILENPSCILYRYEDACYKRYLCLKLIPTPNVDFMAAVANLDDTDFKLFKITADSYRRHLREKSIDFPSADSVSIFGSLPTNTAHSLLERRLNDSDADAKYSFELIEVPTLHLA